MDYKKRLTIEDFQKEWEEIVSELDEYGIEMDDYLAEHPNSAFYTNSYRICDFWADLNVYRFIPQEEKEELLLAAQKKEREVVKKVDICIKEYLKKKSNLELPEVFDTMEEKYFK